MMAGIGEEAAAEEYNILADRMGYLRNRIQVSLDFLCKNSTNLPVVLVHLFSNNVISQHESEVVENQLSGYTRFKQLFTFLIPRLGHEDNSRRFVDAFQKSGNDHILKELKSAVVSNDWAPGPLDTSSHNVSFNVQEQVSSFVGRNGFLRELHQHILRSHRTTADVSRNSTIISRTCVITGLGGIGKTETVRKYIHSYGSCYQHVIWIDAEELNTAENQVRRLALQELDLSSKDKENNAKDFDFILKDVYDHLCTSHTLIVLDNAEALDDSDSQRTAIRRFLPKRLPPTHLEPVIIITSRQLEWPDIHSMPLPLLTTQESSEFLLRQLKLEESDANLKDAEMLSETFGGLPLALQAAAAVITQESKRNKLMGNEVYTVQHLLRDYNNQGKREVLKKRPEGSPDATPLMLLWKVSLDKIRQQPHGHLATKILDVVAHLSPTNIPKKLLFFIFNSEDTESLLDAVALLVDYSFVHSNTHFSIHRMLQDVTLAHLEAPAVEQAHEGELLLTPPLTRITNSLVNYWPTVAKSSEAYDAVHDNLVHVTMSHVLPKVQNQSEMDLHFTEFIEFVFEEIKETQRVEAEKCCQVLITCFTSSTLPSNSAPLFRSPNFKKVQPLRLQLAWILREMGRYNEALNICEETLSEFNSLEDQTDIMSEILATKHELAWLLNSKGEYEEAIKLFSSVIDLRSKLHGPTHKSTLASKNNLALVLQNCGRLSEAKTLHAEVLEVMTKDPGSLHPSTLTTKHNMAVILEKEGHYSDALEMFREVAEVWERELGPLHANTLMSKSCMANVLGEQGKHEDSLRLYADVISRYERASGSSHPDCVWVKNNMALILVKHGKVYEAKEVLSHVLDIQERLLGPSHVDTLNTKHNVAFVLEKEGKDAEALKLFEEVLELRTKQLGPVHPNTLKTNNSVGGLHLKMGNFEKAESIAKEVLAATHATLPRDHPIIKNTEELYENARLRHDLPTHEN